MEVISSETAILYQFVPVYVVCIMNFMPKEHEVTKFRTDVTLRRNKERTIKCPGFINDGNNYCANCAKQNVKCHAVYH